MLGRLARFADVHDKRWYAHKAIIDSDAFCDGYEAEARTQALRFHLEEIPEYSPDTHRPVETKVLSFLPEALKGAVS